MTTSLESLSRKTVRVYAPGLHDRPDMVSISDGVDAADAATDGGPAFLAGALVPRRNWRSPTKEEVQTLFCSRSLGLHRTIGIVRVFGIGTAAALRKRADQLYDKYDYGQEAQLWSHPLLGRVLRTIKHVVRIDGPVTYNSVAKHKHGLVTVTYDRNREARLGLHVDNWEKTGFEDASFVPNRISINLGPDKRYFLFVNITLPDIYKDAHSDCQGGVRTKSDLVQAFFRRHPEYPVVRLAIQPGEAYVAPTENIIHDGSSIDARTQGYHLTFRGRFTMLEPELQPGRLMRQRTLLSQDADAVLADVGI